MCNKVNKTVYIQVHRNARTFDIHPGNIQISERPYYSLIDVIGKVDHLQLTTCDSCGKLTNL